MRWFQGSYTLDGGVLPRGTPLAVKAIKKVKSLTKLEVKQAAKKEAAMLSSLKHHHLVRFYGICKLHIKGAAEASRCLVTEFCVEGTLKDVLMHAEKDLKAAAKKFGQDWRVRMAKEIAAGMAYLHVGVDAFVM